MDRKANIKSFKTVNYHCDKNDLAKNAVESLSEVELYCLCQQYAIFKRHKAKLQFLKAKNIEKWIIMNNVFALVKQYLP